MPFSGLSSQETNDVRLIIASVCFQPNSSLASQAAPRGSGLLAGAGKESAGVGHAALARGSIGSIGSKALRVPAEATYLLKEPAG